MQFYKVNLYIVVTKFQKVCHFLKFRNIIAHNVRKITCNISNRGIRKASVLPLPVTASAATSLPFNNNGIQAAYKYNR